MLLVMCKLDTINKAVGEAIAKLLSSIRYNTGIEWF